MARRTPFFHPFSSNTEEWRKKVEAEAPPCGGASRTSVAVARPDQLQAVFAFDFGQRRVDRGGEARVVQTDREVVAALLGGLLLSDAKLDSEEVGEQIALVIDCPAAGKAKAFPQQQHRLKTGDRSPRGIEGLEAADLRHVLFHTEVIALNALLQMLGDIVDWVCGCRNPSSTAILMAPISRSPAVLMSAATEALDRG